MLVGMLQTLAIVILVSVATHAIATVLRNWRARKFFKLRSSDLPVAPNPGWFSGHAFAFMYGGKNWKNLDGWHAKLGPNFCGFVGDVATVSSVDLDLIKRMLIDEPDKHLNRGKISTFSEELEVDCIATAKDDQWRRIRKAVAPAFASHKIKTANVQAELKSVVDKLVVSIDRRLDEHTRGNKEAIEINADDLFHRYSLALVLSSFYKQDDIIDFDAPTDKTVHEISQTIRALNNPLLKLCVILPALQPILEWFVKNLHPQGRFFAKIKSFIKQQTKLNILARRTIESARESGRSLDEDNLVLSGGGKFRRNLVDYISDQFSLGKLSPREYLHSTFFLFFAANKTSSDAIAKTFYLLASHQEVQEKLRRVIANEGADAEYVSWVILEAMRVYPPALVGSSRTTSGDLQTRDGQLVPAGSVVVTPAYTINRLKEYWGEDADEFRPERWANSKDFHPCQYLTFGVGKRACPGREFAMHSMRTLLAVLLARYKFEQSPKSNGYLMFTAPLLIFLQPDQPTYLRVSHLISQSPACP